jgi:transcriptional regulator with XRE-family HTH domain
MGDTLAPDALEARVAALRAARGWSLDELAERTGISRATLSRLERAETSPTAAMLERLCAAFGWTLSRLMAEAEGEAPPLSAPLPRPSGPTSRPASAAAPPHPPGLACGWS